MLKPSRLEPPLRRVLAIDAGSRCLRLLLLESRFARLRVVQQDKIDLREEGLVSPEEVKAQIQTLLENWGRPSIALALPQHVAVSQIVEVPPAPESEARKLIEEETIKLGGVSESAIVYDFVRVPALDAERDRYWVTFCQEGEIQTRITQLGLDHEDFREVTTAANALLTAWRAKHPRGSQVVLVHAGAQSTTVVVTLNGTGVFATSFPMGGDFFTLAIARLRNCPTEVAETSKRSCQLLDGPERLAGFAEVVDGWVAELKRQLGEWREHAGRGSVKISNLEFVVSGGVFDQPGLLDYLKAKAGLKLERWPADSTPDALQPAMGFEIALGTALQALGRGEQLVSLLPLERRTAWQKRLNRQRLEFANAILLALLFFALAFGVWQERSMIRQKTVLLSKVQAGLESVQSNEALTLELLTEYEGLRPVFEHQQNTLDTLQSLALLQRGPTNRTYWYVLLADQHSYFSQPPTSAPTNKPVVPSEFARYPSGTNVSPARPGLIAEVVVPEETDSARRTLSIVVSELKKAPVFARVDLLSEDLRRSLADPKVILPDRHFALALDFAATEFQRPAPAPKSRLLAPGRAGSRSAPPLNVTNPSADP